MDFEQLVQEAITRNLQQLIPLQMNGYIQLVERKINETVNLKTYNVLEASKETGIGYKKLMSAVKSGNLPSFIDGKVYRIRHTDLLQWIEYHKQKNKLL